MSDWIKCSDRMPSEKSKGFSDYVLTWDGNFVREDRWTWYTAGHYWHWDNSISPTHWMTLPDPPVQP